MVDESKSEDISILQNLLKSLKEQAELITKNINALSVEVDNGDRNTSDGVSLLDVKYFTLSNYIMDILQIINLKINGHSINGCDAVKRSVENRTVLEKICPLEQKIKYQVEKILQDKDDEIQDPSLKFQANVDNFGSDEEESDSGGEMKAKKSDKYIPPHIAAAHYLEEGEEKALKEKERQKALRKSSLLQELSQEHADTPLVITEKTTGKLKVMKRREERKQFEEEYFTRVSLTKRQRNEEKSMSRKSELDSLTLFGASGVYSNKKPNSNVNLKKRKKSFGKSGKKKKRIRM